MRLTLRLHAGDFAICRLEPGAAIPAWANAPGFCSISRTADELSIICTASAVPPGIKQEAGWRLIQLVGPFPLDAIGVLSSLLAPLAQARISVLTVATFDTDYLLIKTSAIAAARSTIEDLGYTFLGPEE